MTIMDEVYIIQDDRKEDYLNSVERAKFAILKAEGVLRDLLILAIYKESGGAYDPYNKEYWEDKIPSLGDEWITMEDRDWLRYYLFEYK